MKAFQFPSHAFRLVICVLALQALTAPAAHACTCVASPGNCRDIRTAAAVFEATVESIELAPKSSPASLAAGAASASVLSELSRLVTLRDVKPLRGEPRTTIMTAAASESCGYEFRAGIRYLIVANRTLDGGLSVSACGLTRLLSESSGLEDYVQALNGSVIQTRVWGQVTMPVRWIGFGHDFDAVPGSRVTAAGPQRRSLVTGADGRYMFENLAAGEYTVSVDLPKTLPQLGKVEPQRIRLDSEQANACAELDFVAPTKSMISGRIADEAGRPLPGVFVRLGLADQLDRSRGDAGAGTETDANGRFRFDDLPPGHYLVGVNISGGPTPGAPFSETYARTTTGETVIPVGVGAKITLPALIARRLTPVVVSGTMHDANGGPARDVEVLVTMFGENGRVYSMFPVKTAADGRFELHLWHGERYRVVVGPRYDPRAEMEFVATGKPLSITLR
jgi:hypothetical protein